VYAYTRVNYFIQRGHEVYSLSLSKNDCHFAPDGLTQFSLNTSSMLIPHIFDRFIHLWGIKRFIKHYSIDILHVIGMLNCFYLPFCHSWKTILENKGSEILITPSVYPVLKLAYKVFYRFCDAVIQDSLLTRNAGILYGAPRNNNLVIEVGTDIDIFNPEVKVGKARKELALEENQPIVFCSRGFSDLYNSDIILRAIPEVSKKYPEVRFVFASLLDGFETKYEFLIKELGIRKNLLVIGNLDQKTKLPFYYRDADVVISIPSSDSSPASVYESMACKTPVIVSDLPWYQGKFEKDRDMVVVPVRDVEKLANAIIQVLSGEKTVNVDSAYEKVLININYETENGKLEKLYEKILSVS
jgi:glycosyltransferase involved in cell wall biosynthesis